jgi:hypothetical protein
MTLTIQFSSREEAWINAQAVEHCRPPAEVVKQLVDAQLPETIQESLTGPDEKTLAAIAMLDAWIEDGERASPEEVRLADLEVEEFLHNLKANREYSG